MEIKREATETLQSLVDNLDETAMVPTLEGGKVVYLLKIECKQPSILQGDIGDYNPANLFKLWKSITSSHVYEKSRGNLAGRAAENGT